MLVTQIHSPLYSVSGKKANNSSVDHKPHIWVGDKGCSVPWSAALVVESHMTAENKPRSVDDPPFLSER